MGFNPPLQMVEDRSLAQRAFQSAESRLNPRQQDVSAPDFFDTQLGAAALEQVTAISSASALCFVLVPAGEFCSSYASSLQRPEDSVPSSVASNINQLAVLTRLSRCERLRSFCSRL